MRTRKTQKINHPTFYAVSHLRLTCKRITSSLNAFNPTASVLVKYIHGSG